MGRQTGEQLFMSSVKVFKLMGPGPLGPYDIANVAAYIDSIGFRDWNEVAMDFSQPWEFGLRWREIMGAEFDPLRNADGGPDAGGCRPGCTSRAYGSW